MTRAGLNNAKTIHQVVCMELLKDELGRDNAAHRQAVLDLVVEILDRSAGAHERLGEYREAGALWNASAEILAAVRARSVWVVTS